MTDWLSTEPEDRRLERPPLALVVCQIRHENEFAASDAARALRINEDLQWGGELTETVWQGLNLSLSPESGLSAASAPRTSGWQIRSADGKWTASIQPDSFALETTAYKGWEDFRDRLVKLVDSVIRHVSPAIEHRIGLRFVNQIQHPEITSPADWHKYIDPAIFQESLYRNSGARLRAAMQVIELAPAKDRTLVIRHGCQSTDNSNQSVYVLDNDSARQGSRAMDSGKLVEEVDGLHKMALQAFEMETTPDLRAYLRGGDQ